MNKNTHSFSFFLTAFLLLSFVSCGGQKKPDGMPPLHPTKITIVQENGPLEGATVTLVNADDPRFRWVVGGVTDAQGICQLKTHGNYQGVPVGKYKVLVQKSYSTGGSEPSGVPQPASVNTPEVKWFDTVDLKYKTVNTTDLEIGIKQGSNVQEFNVGAAVVEEIKPLGGK